MNDFYTISSLIAAVGGALATFFQSFKFVQEGERGVKLHFGRAKCNTDGSPRILEPGFIWMIPWVETLQRRHVRQQTLRFEKQNVMLSNGMIFVINAVVIFKVVDVYKAMFEILDVDRSIEDLSMGILRDQMSQLDHETIVETEKISDSLLKELRVKSEEWGIEFIDFKITHCAPTAESATIVNVKTGTKLKLEALNEAINSTEKDLINSGLSSNIAAVLLGFPLVASTAPSSGNCNELTNLNRTLEKLSRNLEEMKDND